jgi:hypothetical protein
MFSFVTKVISFERDLRAHVFVQLRQEFVGSASSLVPFTSLPQLHYLFTTMGQAQTIGNTNTWWPSVPQGATSPDFTLGRDGQLNAGDTAWMVSFKRENPLAPMTILPDHYSLIRFRYVVYCLLSTPFAHSSPHVPWC